MDSVSSPFSLFCLSGLCAFVAGWAFDTVGGAPGQPHSQIHVGPIALAAAAYYVVNTLGTAAAIPSVFVPREP